MHCSFSLAKQNVCASVIVRNVGSAMIGYGMLHHFVEAITSYETLSKSGNLIIQIHQSLSNEGFQLQ